MNIYAIQYEHLPSSSRCCPGGSLEDSVVNTLLVTDVRSLSRRDMTVEAVDRGSSTLPLDLVFMSGSGKA